MGEGCAAVNDPGWGTRELWDDADAAANDADGVADACAVEAEATTTLARAARAWAQPDEVALAALIQRIAARDGRALDALYAAQAPRVLGFVQRFTGRAALTEEVVEDTFWQVWRQAARFDAQRGRATTWLLAMARSRAIDAPRREQRFAHEPWTGGDDSAAAEQPAAHDTPDLLEATRGAGRLHAAVAALEPRSRQLVALAFFRGLTHEEIAEHAVLPLGTVKSIIRRALLQLRETLQPATAIGPPARPESPT